MEQSLSITLQHSSTKWQWLWEVPWRRQDEQVCLLRTTGSAGPAPFFHWNVWWRNKSCHCFSLPLTVLSRPAVLTDTASCHCHVHILPSFVREINVFSLACNLYYPGWHTRKGCFIYIFVFIRRKSWMFRLSPFLEKLLVFHLISSSFSHACSWTGIWGNFLNKKYEIII